VSAAVRSFCCCGGGGHDDFSWQLAMVYMQRSSTCIPSSSRNGAHRSGASTAPAPCHRSPNLPPLALSKQDASIGYRQPIAGNGSSQCRWEEGAAAGQ
jgi:hypothetical protein